jgi:hypothetical protein
MPCGNCLRSRNAVCVYATNSSPAMPARDKTPQDSRTFQSINQGTSASSNPTTLGDSRATSSISVAAPTSDSPVPNVDALQNRIRQLEEQLALSLRMPYQNRSPALPEAPNSDTSTSTLGGTFHFHHQNRSDQQLRAITHGVTHKKRLFGQSHWLNTMSLVRYELLIYDA